MLQKCNRDCEEFKEFSIQLQKKLQIPVMLRTKAPVNNEPKRKTCNLLSGPAQDYFEKITKWNRWSNTIPKTDYWLLFPFATKVRIVEYLIINYPEQKICHAMPFCKDETAITIKRACGSLYGLHDYYFGCSVNFLGDNNKQALERMKHVKSFL